MARILYTVCGVGLGHATRSSAIIRELMKKHEVFIATYGDAYDFLKNEFEITAELNWFKLIFRQEKFKRSYTLMYNLPLLPYVAAKNIIKGIKLIRAFKPDLVVSDFDINGTYLARFFGIPVITISSMHLMEYLNLGSGMKERIDRYVTEKTVLDFFDGSDYVFIPSFTKPRKDLDGVRFFYPIVRQRFLTERVKPSKRVVVYGPKDQVDALVLFLEKFPKENFIVYNGGKPSIKGNMQFKKFSVNGFAKDVLACKAVMSHGGISLLSEAVVLGKPCYVFPTRDFFERIYNAEVVDYLGFGVMETAPSYYGIKSFLDNLKEYKKNITDSKIKSENLEVVMEINRIAGNLD